VQGTSKTTNQTPQAWGELVVAPSLLIASSQDKRFPAFDH
jgi:hypothetical protein